MDEQQQRLADELLFAEKKSPSFAKRLFFGSIEPSLIFPYPTVPESEEEQLNQFLSKLTTFVDAEIDPDWIDRHQEIPQKVISGLGKLGLLGMTIPTKYGGRGMSQFAYCKAVEVVSGRCGATALFINAHQSIGLKALLLFGTDLQKHRWLVPLANGEQLAAFALTEPNAGSDAAGIETRAEYDPVQNVYRITGKKQWITNGSIASVLTVMAKMSVDTPKGKQDKITAFLVTPEMGGFTVTSPTIEKVGMRGSKTANLEFHNMEVPADSVLGPIGGGLKVALTVLDYGRTTFGAACTGAAKFLVDYAIKHAKTRYQFKRPLGSFGLVKKKIARMGALTYAMDATTYLTAGLIDSESEDIMLESAILKIFASESLWTILYDTMQIYGGLSFFTDNPLERMMRDARLNMIGEGSNDVMRVFISAVGMRDVGVELKGFVNAFKSPIKEHQTFGSMWHSITERLQPESLLIRSEVLSDDAAKFKSLVRSFGFSVARLLGKYREAVLEKQLELERIANSAIALYTAAAVLSKLDSAIQAKSSLNLKNDLAAGRLYCQMAFETIERNLDGIFSPLDEDIEALSDQLTGIKPL